MWRGADEVAVGDGVVRGISSKGRGGVERGRSSKGRGWCGEGQIKLG